MLSVDSLPVDTAPLEQEWFATELIGYQAAWPLPIAGLRKTYCSAEALSDERVRARCDAIAQLILTKAQTVLELIVGRALAKQIGWPKARLDQLEEDQDAMTMAVLDNLEASDDLSADESWNCDHLQRRIQYLSQLARKSEVDVAREAVVRSGIPVADLAQRYKNKTAEIRQATQSNSTPGS
jgi:hypothetical protein